MDDKNKVARIFKILTGPRSACHSAESLFCVINVNEHNSLESPGKDIGVDIVMKMGQKILL